MKVMANDFISPVGLPEKGVRIWILGQSDFALGQTSLVILLAVLRSHGRITPIFRPSMP